MPVLMRPIIVFSHANGFPAGTYRKLFSLLASQVEVRAPDMLGHDPRFPVNNNWSNLSRELIAFLRTHDDRPVYAVGHSMGAVVSFLAACHEPVRFRGLIMLDPPIISGMPGHVFRLMKWLGRTDAITPAGRSKNRRVHWATREEALADFSRKKLFDAWDPDCLRDYVDAGTTPANAPGAGGVALRYQVASEVAAFRTTPTNLQCRRKKLAVPALIATGTDSEVAMPQHFGPLQRRHRMAHCVVPGGHLFPLQYPQETARLLLSQIEAWEQQP